MIDRSSNETMKWIALRYAAATRHLWATYDRSGYNMTRSYGTRRMHRRDFITCSEEHMNYSLKAMELMGITEEDQFYA